jgi:AraC family transcriptional regulator
MATPQAHLEAMRAHHAQPEHRIPKIYERLVKWEGVKIGHFRMPPGRIHEVGHFSHQVFVPLAGAVTITGRREDGLAQPQYRVPGEISVTPAGVKYCAHWENDFDYLAVSLSETFLQRATTDFAANRRARIVLSCGPRDSLVTSIGQLLAQELDAELPAGKLYAESLVNTLAVHVLRHYSTESLIPDVQFGGLPAHKLRRATEFIESHLEHDLTLTEIAAAVELSQYHFARAFKHTTQQTPIQFLMERRVELAKRLLKQSELPLVEISQRAGFKNQSHFSTFFRKATGLTPKAFRNEHKI